MNLVEKDAREGWKQMATLIIGRIIEDTRYGTGDIHEGICLKEKWSFRKLTHEICY